MKPENTRPHRKVIRLRNCLQFTAKQKFFSTLILLLVLHATVAAQRVYQLEEKLEGQIFLTPQIAIPVENAGYTLMLPESGKAKGLVVFFNANRDPLPSNKEPNLEFYALQHEFGVLYVTTGNRLEFFFEETKLKQIDRYINEVLNKYHLPKENLLFAGMSLAGTRALKYTIFSKQNKGIVPKAIAICDSPLDFVRFWREAVKARDLNFHPAAANEGAWVSGYLEANLGGTPKDQFQKYAGYSPYCYSLEEKGNEQNFVDIAIRAYTEPDVKWWMATRRKDYYSMNAVDFAAFINELNIMGNQNAELILTMDNGYLPDGSRHPHSWSIVDNKELIDWFVSLPAKQKQK
jgi:hypothetical protein